MDVRSSQERIGHLAPGDYCFYCLYPNPGKIIAPTQITYHCANCDKTDGLKLRLDPGLKSAWHHGELQHFTIGTLLRNLDTNKFLLMKKRTYPQMIDVIAGHIRTNETPEQTLLRETEEETGFKLTKYKLLWEGMAENDLCRRGAPHHYWYLFLSSFRGVPRPDLQEVDYFKEYTWEEMLAEPMLNPPIKKVLAGLSTDLLTL